MDDRNRESVCEETYLDVLESSIVQKPKSKGGFIDSRMFVVLLLVVIATVGFGVSFFMTLYLS